LKEWKHGIPKNRAALISGPPGIGKSTTAAVVCQEHGYEVVEFNASDTRSKSSLKEHVASMLGCHSIGEFFGAKPRVLTSYSSQASFLRSHSLILPLANTQEDSSDHG
jgi:DNA polymerase III delta prime subunit